MRGCNRGVELIGISLPQFILVAGLLSSFSLHLSAQTSEPIQFTDVTAAAGIKFVHFKGNNGISINREEFGPGVCVADFDGDGWQDIYFVNGRNLYDRGIAVRNALYRNKRGWGIHRRYRQGGRSGDRIRPRLRVGRLRQ